MGLEAEAGSHPSPRPGPILRIALLTLLAAASLNGLMVFLFFDGTNFYGHLSGLQAKAQAALLGVAALPAHAESDITMQSICDIGGAFCGGPLHAE